MNELSVPEFERAEKLAKELRLLQPNSDLALDVLSMEFDRYIYFDTFEAYSKAAGVPLNELTMNGKLKDGYTVRLNDGKNLILYHEKNKGTPRLNWTLAHEIGHIYFNHYNDGDTQEVEANFFAAELLMPTVIFNRIARKISFTPEKISKTFFVSKVAAGKKIETLRSGHAGSAYLVKELLEKYVQTVDTIINHYSQMTIVTKIGAPELTEIQAFKKADIFSANGSTRL